uniref:Uncharacterized protein n=1 Tax=Anguilla anguilla TaxID=7936 RepID=A0A0E9PLM5_ANGAN
MCSQIQGASRGQY